MDWPTIFGVLTKHPKIHICLKQDKAPQNSHNETHNTQGLTTNQIQPSRHPKHTGQLPLPRINLLKQP